MSDLKEQKQAPAAAATAAPAAELDPAAAAKKAAKEAKNEEKRLAKLAKFAAKQAKVRSRTEAGRFVKMYLLINRKMKPRRLKAQTLTRRRRPPRQPLLLFLSTRHQRAKRKVGNHILKSN